MRSGRCVRVKLSYEGREVQKDFEIPAYARGHQTELRRAMAWTRRIVHELIEEGAREVEVEVALVSGNVTRVLGASTITPERGGLSQ